ncbi:hypothetical protein CHS0354_019779, partial [Potamilus streckersoni]
MMSKYYSGENFLQHYFKLEHEEIGPGILLKVHRDPFKLALDMSAISAEDRTKHRNFRYLGSK